MAEKDRIGTSKRRIIGKVVSSKMRSTVSVEIERRVLLPKYGRFAKKYSVIKAHNPEKISAGVGDVVTVAECRPISKTKHFMVVKKHSKEGDE